MKKVITLSIYMLAMVTGMATYANTASTNFDGGKKKEITLTLNNVKEGQKLSIKDNYGTILYNTKIASTGFYNNKFDLTALPNGEYSFEHEKGYEIKVIPFTVAKGEVTFNKQKEVSVFKPVVNFKDNNVYVNKLDLNKEKVNVNIYYASNDSEFQLIHSDEITDTTNVKRIYGLSQKRAGSYKVIINADGRDYVEYFKI
ncbi:hypothetical protein [Formosa haliotis]|uniref:hypothetical protein n=1 Tax=Formosa haliotis TaxID=1555194 RepID=UPI000826F5B6|nr:hypothetical protein [Formosa haliotis]